MTSESSGDRSLLRDELAPECPICGMSVTGGVCPLCGWVPPVDATAHVPPSSVVDKMSARGPLVGPGQLAEMSPPDGREPDQTPAGGSVTSGRRRTFLLIAAALMLVSVIAAVANGLGAAKVPSSAVEPGRSASQSTESVPEGGVDTPALAGGWVAVLDSISQTDGQFGEARSLADSLTSKYGVQVYVIDSSNYTGLNPGWWAVVLIGFDSNAEARAACASVGRKPSGACYGRKITG